VRLHADAFSDIQVEQHGGRTDKYGQFVLAVENARDDRMSYSMPPLLPSSWVILPKPKALSPPHEKRSN
jgi:hypothetical protein